MDNEDGRRLDWLLTLIWDTGHRDQESAIALKRLKRLRRYICDSQFPFRGALDQVIEEVCEEQEPA
jgi:hypothetical protein